MSKMSNRSRRSITVIAVAASLVLGFGAIQASAAWTQSVAPLPAAPVSAETLQARLADEALRSASLVDQLAALTRHSDELATALTTAQARISADDDQAAQLGKDLAAAKAKLAKLEKSIKRARMDRIVVTSTTSTTSGAARTSHREEHDEDEHEGGGDHDDD